MPSLTVGLLTQKRPDAKASDRVIVINCPLATASRYAVKDEPQPQLPVAFGFLNVKPEPITFVT